MAADSAEQLKHATIPVIPGAQSELLLKEISDWGNVTTIVFSGGSVFEFKGEFPEGKSDFGFYNLHGPTPGLHGHLKLDNVDHISFQTKPHRGRESYALVFNDSNNDVIFKIFLGRDANGELLSNQKAMFFALIDQYQGGSSNEE